MSNIALARTKLSHAIARLCGPQHRSHHQHLLTAPSLYDQLATNLAARQGDTRTPAQSLPPLWVDALQLRAEIDGEVKTWAPGGGSTPDRLTKLADKSWRPQDTDTVYAKARRLAGWCDSIVNLLDPEHKKFIDAACPSCGRRHVHRRDSAGEMVRQPALVVITNIGASCQHCEAAWSPDRYLFLCRLLGFELPEGVLE